MTEPHEPPTEHDELLRSWFASVMSDGQEEPRPEDLAALGERVQAGIAAEDSRPLAPLRRRPAWQRNLVGLGVLALAVVFTALVTPRGDLVHYPLGRLAFELGSYVAVFAACLAVATRGTHRPELPRAWVYGLAALAVLVAAGVAVLPPPHAHDPHVSRGFGEVVSYCGPGGILLALPVASVIMVLLRHTHARYVQSELYETPPAPHFEPEEIVESAVTHAAIRALDTDDEAGETGETAGDGTVLARVTTVERTETVTTETIEALRPGGAPPERPA